MKKFKLFLLPIILCGCVKSYPAMNDATNSAHNVIDTVVAEKPECKNVGKICNEQVNMVANACKAQIKTESDKSFNKGMSWGFFGGIFSLIALAVLGIFISNKFIGSK